MAMLGGPKTGFGGQVDQLCGTKEGLPNPRLKAFLNLPYLLDSEALSLGRLVHGTFRTLQQQHKVRLVRLVPPQLHDLAPACDVRGQPTAAICHTNVAAPPLVWISSALYRHTMHQVILCFEAQRQDG